MILTVTQAGASALASAMTTGAAVAFTRYAVGGGTFNPSSMDASAMTGLISQIARVDVSEVRRGDMGVVVIADVDNTMLPTGASIRETGLFARLNSGQEFLFAYGYMESPEVVPPRVQSLYERRFTSHIEMSDDEIALTVTTNAMAEAIFEALGLSVVDGALCQTYPKED